MKVMYMYVCEHVYLHSMYVCIACMYACVCVCVCVEKLEQVYAQRAVHVCKVCVCMYAYVYMCMYICILCMYACMYVGRFA